MAPTVTRSALTLIELLIVLALLGILAALAIPSMQPATSEYLVSAAEVFAADVNSVRSLAVMGNSSYRLTFDVANQRYILQHVGSNPGLHVLPTDGFGSAADPATQRIGRLDRLPIIGPPVQLVKAKSSSGATVTSVEFGALGATASASETIVWLSAGTAASQRWIPLRIDPVTGLARVGSLQSIAPP